MPVRFGAACKTAVISGPPLETVLEVLLKTVLDTPFDAVLEAPLETALETLFDAVLKTLLETVLRSSCVSQYRAAQYCIRNATLLVEDTIRCGC